MNPSHFSRRRRSSRIGVESLEGRALLTGGMGSTFAIVPGAVATKGGTTSFTFTIDPTHFTMPKSGKVLIGIDIATETGSSIVPYITGVANSKGQEVPGTTHARYAPSVVRTATSYGDQTSAVVTPLSLGPGNTAATYTVTVKGEKNTSGSFLYGFYLAGDANGDGIINQTDVAAVRQDMGLKAGATNYSFDADANRDGVINGKDLAIVEKNMGALTTINPSLAANLNPSDETALQNNVTTMTLVNYTGTATPGATVTYTNSTYPAMAPASTTANSTGNYSIMVNLGNGSNTFNVATSDAFGQKISGSITPVTYDANAPTSLISVASTTS